MNPSVSPFKDWFGYTRRERRAAFILLLLIALVSGIRYAVPGSKMVVKDVALEVPGLHSFQGTREKDNTHELRLFFFDPNNASYDTLIRLGFSGKEAGTLLNYRKKGGKFRKPDDIKKIYGLESWKAEQLIPYVKLETVISGQSAGIRTTPQQKVISINSCDTAVLIALPCIGPVLAKRIIGFRNLLGGFVTIDQLREVYGLSEETFICIREFIYVDTTEIVRMRINSADYRELVRHPYFQSYDVTSILKYRELKGRVYDINDLIDNNLITSDKAAKIKPYLAFD